MRLFLGHHSHALVNHLTDTHQHTVNWSNTKSSVKFSLLAQPLALPEMTLKPLSGIFCSEAVQNVFLRPPASFGIPGRDLGARSGTTDAAAQLPMPISLAPNFAPENTRTNRFITALRTILQRQLAQRQVPQDKHLIFHHHLPRNLDLHQQSVSSGSGSEHWCGPDRHTCST